MNRPIALSSKRSAVFRMHSRNANPFLRDRACNVAPSSDQTSLSPVKRERPEPAQVTKAMTSDQPMARIRQNEEVRFRQLLGNPAYDAPLDVLDMFRAHRLQSQKEAEGVPTKRKSLEV